MRCTQLLAALACLLALLGPSTLRAADQADSEEGWISLFDGKSLGDWRPNEKKECFTVKDGAIVVNGPRCHLFYMGKNNDFTNFHFSAEAKTEPNSNSGIYIHTRWQDEGWPSYGYESQVNVSHGDKVKSGSLYNTVKIYKEDIEKAGLKDNTWWTQEIIVRGKRIVVKLNGKTVIDYTEPEGKEGKVKLSHGTFALQAHDPGSTVYFRNLKVKPLP